MAGGPNSDRAPSLSIHDSNPRDWKSTKSDILEQPRNDVSMLRHLSPATGLLWTYQAMAYKPNRIEILPDVIINTLFIHISA